MYQAFRRQTPQSSAHSRRGLRAARHQAKRAHVPSGSFDWPTRDIVLAQKVEPQDLHIHLCVPSALRPFLTTPAWLHLGQQVGLSSASQPARSAAIAALSASKSSLFSSMPMPARSCVMMSVIRPSSYCVVLVDNNNRSGAGHLLRRRARTFVSIVV